jgi:hypothetical protein
MATNVANQPSLRHPISERNRTHRAPIQPDGSAVMPGFGPAIHASSNPPIQGVDARRAPGMTISI